MEQFLQGLSGFVWTLAGAAVVCLCGYIAKKANGFFAEHAANNQVAAEHGELKQDVAETKQDISILKEGLKALIKVQMVIEHSRLVHQHYATPDEKDHFEDMYQTYRALGGNGTGEALYKDVMSMYSIAPTEFKEES